MKQTRLTFFLLVLGAALAAPTIAQTPTPSTTPAPKAAVAPAPRLVVLVSPEINADGGVTFRVRAPNAKQVSVRGQWAKDAVALTLGEGGVWSGAAASVPVGVWEYSFVVDGFSMVDPGNAAIKPMREPRTSILHIAASAPQPWDFQDLPHGTVHQHSYLSKSLGRSREVWVYTPPGYEANAASKYPLLVLQHGSGDNQQTWVAHGKAHWILDNLIAAGKVKPMVVMMIDGHPFTPAKMREASGDRGAAMPAFRKELLEEAMPLVEKTYRLEPGREQRGIVGLSMGGSQSITVGLGNLDRFAWVGAFSGSSPEEAVTTAFLADPKAANAKLKLLWFACGKDDALHTRNEEFDAKLTAAGIKHEWHLTAGNHSWPVWRNYLVDFLPLVFQPAKK